MHFTNKYSAGLNTGGYNMDNYTIIANNDSTLLVTVIDKSSQKNREVRLLIEVKIVYCINVLALNKDPSVNLRGINLPPM